MSDQAENIIETDGTFVYDNPEAEWAAVLAVAPAMDRLPEMVASTYHGHGLPDGTGLEELRGAVRDRVRTGSIFVFKLLDNNVNKLFENFSIHFGQGIDLLMDDLETAMSSDMEAVENYSHEEVCGRLFAYIAMDIYTHGREEREPNATLDMFDEHTGFFKDSDLLGCIHYLEAVANSVKMAEDFGREVREWAVASIRGQIFLMADRTDKTVLH